MQLLGLVLYQMCEVRIRLGRSERRDHRFQTFLLGGIGGGLLDADQSIYERIDTVESEQGNTPAVLGRKSIHMFEVGIYSLIWLHRKGNPAVGKTDPINVCW